MSVWLRQGKETIRLELLRRWNHPPVLAPGALQRRELARDAAGLPAERETVQSEALETELARSGAAERFLERARRARRVCLVLPDATRRGAWQAWVGVLLRSVRERTPAAKRRTVLVATGVHRPSIPEGVGPSAGWEIVANGIDGYGAHREVGRTRAGTPVRLHPLWIEADLRVVLGDVSFHYLAGFGGGRKLVFPGLGEPEGILKNHRLSLDGNGRLHGACAPGQLEGNPVHQDLVDAVSFAPPELLVQLVEPEAGRAPRLQVGSWQETHERGCRLFGDGHRLEHTCRPDLLIADAGGWPRDATVLQAQKSLQHAARFLAPGGRLLLVAGLEEGVGSAVLEDLWGLDATELTRRAVSDYRLHTHTALAMRNVCDTIEVALWSRMEPERLRRAGLVPLGSERDAVEWLERGGQPRRWGWLARAEEVLPRFVGDRGARQKVDPAGVPGPEEEHG